MRYDTEHKQRTHLKIVEEAAAAIRRDGPDKVGVAGLMASAGLTHGGFYAHFKSKDDLVAEAITHMFDERHRAFLKDMDGVSPADGLRAYITRYLSPRHLERRDRGCPAASLSGDAARLPDVARARFDAGVNRIRSSVAGVLRELQREFPDALADTMVAEMVGALSIARIMNDTEAAGRLLDTVRADVLRRAGLAT